MKGLSNLLDKVVVHLDFKHHKKCKDLNITHLCFIDDLMLFCKVEEKSIFFLRDALKTIEGLLGLKAKVKKSNIFFSGEAIPFYRSIAPKLGFKVGTLSIKYLGVPLITSKLKIGDCKPLMNKIFSLINSWRNKFLSYAGCLMLIKLILFSIQVYWASL